MMAWKMIVYSNTARSLGSERKARLPNVDPREDIRADSHRIKERQDFKENLGENVNGLSIENKKLKS